ncbi:Uncharacterised protein [Bacillus subtilis]|nr:uncharacterized protein S101392_02409 [Bacillus subtilis subsp. subtilis]CJR82211.1 Uncharacterised protein [Streptococcus pneumoniae]CON25418.1 Uncharacterised protein [Bacillus subtilis]
MQVLTGLLEQYGYAVLFIVLMLELLALLGPGEFAGVLVFQEKLNWVLSMLAAGLGSCAGVSMSYWIGYRLGPAAISESFCVERCSVSHYCSNLFLDNIQRARSENRTLFLIFPSRWWRAL